MRILVSDTTWNMASVSRLMRDRGFLVSEARDAADILHHLDAARFDAVLLDPDLPDMDIHCLTRRIRLRFQRLPICHFARDWCRDTRLHALAAGADDVTGWPYDGDEIASRLRAYIRRSHGFASQAPSFGGLTVDLDRRVVSFGARSIHLTRLEYELVEMLALADGRLVSRDAIMTRLYGWEDEPEAKIIDVYICRIRAKLATLDAPRGLIATRVGHGYRIDPFADTGWGAAA